MDVVCVPLCVTAVDLDVAVALSRQMTGMRMRTGLLSAQGKYLNIAIKKCYCFFLIIII